MKEILARLSEALPGIPNPILNPLTWIVRGLRNVDSRVKDLENILYKTQTVSNDRRQADDTGRDRIPHTTDDQSEGEDVSPAIRVPKDNDDDPPKPTVVADGNKSTRRSTKRTRKG